MESTEEKYIIGYEELDAGIREMGRQVLELDPVPDTIVTVPRGGSIIGTYLAHFTGIIPIDIGSYLTGIKLGEPEGIPILIDDVIETGKTLDRIYRLSLTPMYLGCFAYKPGNGYRADVSFIHTDKWIEFPWERLNDF